MNINLNPPNHQDPLLSILIRQIEKQYLRRIRDNPYNKLKKSPRALFLALTHLEMLNAYVWASRGAIIDDTLTNQDLDNFIFSEVRVGTEKGTGLGYHSDYLPLKKSYRSLEKIINASLKESFQESTASYYDYLKESVLKHPVFLPNLAETKKVIHLKRIRKPRTPHKKLRNLAKKCSEILSETGNDSLVKIRAYRETRRYANSEGALIRDFFFGYHFRFIVKTLDKERRPLEFIQNIYFTENWQISQRRVLGFVKHMAKEVEKRKDCPVLETGVYPVLFLQEAMATQLHECLTHLLASDNILEYDSTVWGWENFGQQVANRYLDVYTDPGMPGRWGSMDYDYECVPATRRQLIEQGRIIGYLADRNGAYHLSHLLKEEILPGDARFGITENNTHFPPQPRISNLDVYYSGPRQPKSEADIRKRFRQYLKKHDLTGVYIPDGSGAASLIEDGQIEAYPNFPYIVTSQGKFIPTKFIETRNYAQLFMKNIMVMGRPRKYVPHLCEDNNFIVRAGLMCGSGIVKNVQISARRFPSRRQK